MAFTLMAPMLVLSLNIQDIGTDGIRRSSNFTQEEFEEKQS
jgi:hypothetical protein